MHGPCFWPLVKLFDDGAIFVCPMLELQCVGVSFSSLHGLSFNFDGRELPIGCSPFSECDDGRPCMPLQVAFFAWCFQLLAAYVDFVPVLSGWFFPSHS